MQAAKKLMLASALALGGTGIAQAATVIYADIAPPAVRVEHVPHARAGHVWAPGHWGWRHHKYVWVEGRWMHQRHGYHYRPARWEHEGNRWRYYDGGWDR
ncbi:MAG TPA: YXWGXW repeat-containing protein [Rhodanobacteraceae bacterium]|nr:YXWGXW repeat-containing protein [Rhodanobacteraceae bacterium]